MKLRKLEGLFVLGLAASAATSLVVACSSSSSSGAGGGDDAGTALDATGSHDSATHDDGSDFADSAPAADVQIPCGDAGPCTSGQLCVTFTTSGGSCDQTLIDAGACPPGYVAGCHEADGGMAGCEELQVNQACQLVPSDCSSTISCALCGASLCATCDCLGADAAAASCGCLGQ